MCDKWPIMSVDEMPPVQCLPPPDRPERAARRQRKETRRKERETKRNKRPRRDTWKEKTPKEKAKERRRGNNQNLHPRMLLGASEFLLV